MSNKYGMEEFTGVLSSSKRGGHHIFIWPSEFTRIC